MGSKKTKISLKISIKFAENHRKSLKKAGFYQHFKR